MTADANIYDVRDYWDARPCNVRHSPAPVGSRAWSREVTERKYLVEPHIPRFAQFWRWRGKKVLELGCGIGTDTLEFLRAGAELVTAVDVSPASLALAKERVRQVEEDAGGAWYPATFLCANAERWLPGLKYDLIYAFGMLHHTPRPERVLALARERLARDGELRVMLYARWSIKRIFGERPEAAAGCPIVRWYTEVTARKLLTDAGFEVTEATKTHLFPWRIKDYVAHRYVRRWPYRLLPAAAFAWLERKLGHHLLLVARRAR